MVSHQPNSHVQRLQTQRPSLFLQSSHQQKKIIGKNKHNRTHLGINTNSYKTTQKCIFKTVIKCSKIHENKLHSQKIYCIPRKYAPLPSSYNQIINREITGTKHNTTHFLGIKTNSYKTSKKCGLKIEINEGLRQTNTC